MSALLDKVLQHKWLVIAGGGGLIGLYMLMGAGKAGTSTAASSGSGGLTYSQAAALSGVPTAAELQAQTQQAAVAGQVQAATVNANDQLAAVQSQTAAGVVVSTGQQATAAAVAKLQEQLSLAEVASQTTLGTQSNANQAAQIQAAVSTTALNDQTTLQALTTEATAQQNASTIAGQNAIALLTAEGNLSNNSTIANLQKQLASEQQTASVYQNQAASSAAQAAADASKYNATVSALGNIAKGQPGSTAVSNNQSYFDIVHSLSPIGG